MYRPQLTALLLAATIPAAAQHTLRGRVLEGESPVGYATTVLLRDGRQAAGTTTDDAGGFVLTADTGRYTLVRDTSPTGPSNRRYASPQRIPTSGICPLHLSESAR